MDVHKLAQLKEISGGGVAAVRPTTGAKDLGKGPSFDETLKRVGGDLAGAAEKATSSTELVFSKHAVERMRSRGIGMDPFRMSRLETALGKAAEKGSKNTLVLMDENAFIMSVKNKTIVTAMDKGALKENLFTNIDSTIIV